MASVVVQRCRASEAARFFASSVPIFLVDFIKLAVITITTMKVGRALSTTALAGASMGALCFNVAGNMIASAPLAAMETIAPQAFGAGNPVGVGLASQRAFLLAVLFLLPTLPVWIYAEDIMVALGQPPGVAEFGKTYMRLLAPGLLPFLTFEIARKFVYAQECTRIPPLVAAGVGLCTHFGWLELWCRSIGVAHGAPIALSCTYLTMALILVVLIAWRVPRAVDAWPRHAHTQRLLWTDLAGWRHFFSTSAAALLTLTEWLFWEVTAFRVGRFGTVPFAAYSVAYNIEPVLFMLPLGLSTALSNAVGNHLGAGRPAAARRIAVTALGLGVVVVAVYTSLILAIGYPIATLFSGDDEVLHAASDLWPAFCTFLATSGPFAMLLGLIRGLGLQRPFAIIVATILWPVGAGLVIGVAKDPSQVWLCLTCTYWILITCLSLLAYCSSWQRLSDVAIAANANAVAKSGLPDLEPATMTEIRSSTNSAASGGGLAATDASAASRESL